MDPRAPSTVSVNSGYKSCVYFTNTGIYDKDYHPADLPVEKFTHIFYAFFSPSIDGVVSSIDTFADFEKRYPDDSADEDENSKIHGCVRQFSLLKKKNRHLKVVLSIGGPAESVAANFAALSASPAGRANFVESSLETLRDCGYDGIDIYWEWPKDAVEATNYTLLLGEIRRGLDEYASDQGSKHLSLSVACPAGTEQYTLLDLEGMDRYVDFWNLVAHDFAGDSISTVTAHQANVFTGQKELSTPYNPAQAVSDLLDHDIEPQKILLGCPLYGRGFANTDGLGKSFSGAPTGDFEQGIRDYKNLPPSGAEVKLDPAANAAYSYDNEKKELFSYDNPASLSLKSNFIQSQQLGGAMFWEASGDRKDEGSLTTLMALDLGGDDYAGLDRSENTITYPGSKFINIRGVET